MGPQLAVRPLYSSSALWRAEQKVLVSRQRKQQHGGAMKAKEAIAQAKTFLSEFYAGEAVSGVRLEEVEFDEPSDS